MQLVVDRIVAGIAICETTQRTMVEIPVQQFTEPLHEGDVVIKEGNKLSIDKEMTQRRKEEIGERFSRLLKN